MVYEQGGNGPDTGTGYIKVNRANLDLARRAAGLSQRQLADRARISAGHISRILAGTSDVTPEVMDQLLAVFGNRITFGELRSTEESQRAPSGSPDGAL